MKQGSKCGEGLPALSMQNGKLLPIALIRLT